MKTRDYTDLVMLAALWGASFLFIRIAVPHFGPVPLMFLRVSIGGMFLLPLLIARHGVADLKQSIAPIFVLGVINSSIPFSLLAYASISLTAGFVSILNASSPMFAAVVAYLWLKDKLSPLRILGLVVGFIGVVVLVWGKAEFKPGGSGFAIVAALLAALFYGIAANFTKKRLNGVNSLAIACGSQLCAAVALLPLAVIWWPHDATASLKVWLTGVNPLAVACGNELCAATALSPLAVVWSPEAAVTLKVWLTVIALGVACTGIAFILYFRLIANAGPAKAITVTFLVPVFGVLWGALFLDEIPTVNMLAGCAIILAGTALTTGLIAGRPQKRLSTEST